jgi:hypothetical protein
MPALSRRIASPIDMADRMSDRVSARIIAGEVDAAGV